MKLILICASMLIGSLAIAGEPAISPLGVPGGIIIPEPRICGPGGPAMEDPRTGECVSVTNSCTTGELADRGWVVVDSCSVGRGRPSPVPVEPLPTPVTCWSPEEEAAATAYAQNEVADAIATQMGIGSKACFEPQSFCDDIGFLDEVNRNLENACFFQKAAEENTIWPVRNLSFSQDEISQLLNGVCDDDQITTEEERTIAAQLARGIASDSTLESLPTTRGRPTTLGVPPVITGVPPIGGGPIDDIPVCAPL